MKFKFLSKYRLYLHKSPVYEDKYRVILVCKSIRSFPELRPIERWEKPYVDFYAIHPAWRKIQRPIYGDAELIQLGNNYIYSAILSEPPFAEYPDLSLKEYFPEGFFEFVWNKTEVFSVKDYISKKSLTASDILILHQIKNMFCCKLVFNATRDRVERLD